MMLVDASTCLDLVKLYLKLCTQVSIDFNYQLWNIIIAFSVSIDSSVKSDLLGSG